MRRQKKLWMIPVMVLLVIVVGFLLFWPTLRVYLAPKTVLSAALKNTYSILEQRIQNSPIVLLGNTIDIENGNTIELNLDSGNDLLKSIEYDMTVMAEWNPKHISAQGQVAAQGKSLDMSVYLNSDFAALSSSGILGGKFYGLTYKTFPQDIRSNRFISLVVGERVLKEWEDSVSSLQTFMAQSYTLPSISEADMRKILVGVLALKADVDRDYVTINGISEECFVISFETTGAAIVSGADYLNMDLPFLMNPNDEVDVMFWVQEDRIVKTEIEIGDREVELYFGTDPASGELRFRYAGDGQEFTVSVNTHQNASEYQEAITIYGAKNSEIRYSWDLTNGNLILDTDLKGEKQSVSLNLSAAENGMRLESGDFEALMHLLTGSKDTSDSPCTLIVTKGAEITTPAYKNFSEWSLEDLITLVTGVGSLFGLKIG